MISATAWSEEEQTVEAPTPDPVKSYFDTIDRTETESGAYSEGLAELYQGLAQSLLEADQLEEARSAFQQGAQIVRINYGLNSPDQTNYLFPIADIESQLGNWKMADNIIQNIYSINESSFGTNHPDLLPVLSQMLTWYEDRYLLQPKEDRYANLAKIEQILVKMISIIEGEKDIKEPDTAVLYRKVGQLHYYMAEILSSTEKSSKNEFEFDMGGSRYEMTEVANQKFTPSHYRIGTEAYNKFVESVGGNSESNPLQYAEAFAQLGDWHMTFSKPQTASKAYQQAYDVLVENQQSETTADEYFGQPTPMRFLRAEVFPESDPGADSETYLEVSMTITKKGFVRNLEFNNLSEKVEKNHVKGIRKKIGSLRFRPQLSEGETVQTDGFIWRYAIEETEG